MHILRSRDRCLPATVIRAWELDTERYPYRSEQEWAALIKARRERSGLVLLAENHNRVTDPGMETCAAIIRGDAQPWQTGRWYRQALGCSAASPKDSDRELGSELYRKAFTEHTRAAGSRVNYCLTVFYSTDFASQRTTVLAAPAPTAQSFAPAALGNIQGGDLLRVALPTGYEYGTVQSTAGGVITLKAPLTAVPLTGATVDQVVDEAGLFGDVPASYTTGTATFTNGSAVVTGAGTAWLNKLASGDKIRLANSRTWATVLSVDSDTQLTLTAPWAGATTTGAYVVRGTMYNHVAGLGYIKPTDRAFAFENQWTMGGV